MVLPQCIWQNTRNKRRVTSPSFSFSSSSHWVHSKVHQSLSVSESSTIRIQLGFGIMFLPAVSSIINRLLLVMMTTLGVFCSIVSESVQVNELSFLFKFCVWIYIYNDRRLKRLKNASDKYTLSLKFQLIENIRAFRVSFIDLLFILCLSFQFMRTAALLGIPSILIVVSPFAVGVRIGYLGRSWQ